MTHFLLTKDSTLYLKSSIQYYSKSIRETNKLGEPHFYASSISVIFSQSPALNNALENKIV